MAKNRLIFEKDEKKSILIAAIVSIIVIVAVVLSFVAIRNYRNRNAGVTTAAGAENLGTEMPGTESGVPGATTVTNQDELNVALADTSTTAILFQTEVEQTIVIPSGDYAGIAMTIDAPYTDVTNYGTFASITINQISSDTWTESVSGNTFIIDAASSHIIVPSGITVNGIENVQANSTLAAEVQGSVASMGFEADNSITSVSVDGELQQATMYNVTNLTLTGTRTDVTGLNVEYGAAGSTISTAIPLNLTSMAAISVTFEPGAEGSAFTISAAENTMSLQNNTTGDITVTKPDGTTETVSASAAYTYEGTATTTSTEEPQLGENNTERASAASGAPSVGSTVSSNRGTSSGTASTGSTPSGTTPSGTTPSGTTPSGTTQTGDTEKNDTEKSDTQTTGYTEAQVKKMVEKAVAEATSGLLTNAQVNKLISDAVSAAKKEAVAGMVSQTTVQSLIDSAVSAAVKDVLAKSVITSFVTPSPTYIGESGSGNLKTVKQLGLPTQLEGRTNTGTSIYAKVAKWNNDNHYSATASPGEYRFTAELESGYYIASGVKAQAVVYVGDGHDDHTIVYQDTSFQTTIGVEEYLSTDEKAIYYAIQNRSQQSTYVGLSFYYFDSAGNMISTLTEKWFGSYIMPESGWIAEKIKQDGNSLYHRYVVVVDAYTDETAIAQSKSSVNAGITGSSLNVQVVNQSYGEEILTECSVVVLITGEKDGVRMAYAYNSFQTGDCNGGINEWPDYTKSYNISNVKNAQYIVWKTGGYVKE